jgi:hypothetical protein
MNRSIDRWNVCNPSAMAQQSIAAITYAFEDARHDMLELAQQNKRLRELLRISAYPSRGTDEESLTIYDFAQIVQSAYTLDQLENGL